MTKTNSSRDEARCLSSLKAKAERHKFVQCFRKTIVKRVVKTVLRLLWICGKEIVEENELVLTCHGQEQNSNQTIGGESEEEEV